MLISNCFNAASICAKKWENNVDTFLINDAFVLAGDSKYRLSSRRDRNQAPTLSFTHNPASNQIFMHLDGDFTYSRAGYYPESNSIELYLNMKELTYFYGNLRTVVRRKDNVDMGPELKPWKHENDVPQPTVLEEYRIQSSAIMINHPIGLVFKPRTSSGFSTYVSIVRGNEYGNTDAEPTFRIKFWLTEKSIPELDLLHRYFRQDMIKRTQPMSFTFNLDKDELSILLHQLEALKKRYDKEVENN